VDEVERPTLVHDRYDGCRVPTAERDPAPDSLSDLEICFAVDASNAFDVHHPTLTAQHHVQTTIAEPSTLGSQFFEAPAKWRIVAESLALVAEHSSIALRDFVRSPFADGETFANCSHRSTALCRRQKFPSAMIFKASISSRESASSRFNRRFSSSSAAHLGDVAHLHAAEPRLHL
jgi:hypothetical protein